MTEVHVVVNDGIALAEWTSGLGTTAVPGFGVTCTTAIPELGGVGLGSIACSVETRLLAAVYDGTCNGTVVAVWTSVQGTTGILVFLLVTEFDAT